jgi:ATP-dependent Lhr-like helicase
VGIGQAARRLGIPLPEVTVGVRSGDTTSADRRKLIADPPDILITTPESLYLMLTSQAAETLRDVHTVIVDEVHAVAATKRGAHLAVSLERLDALRRDDDPAQRVGLSATVRPIDEVARFPRRLRAGRDRRPRATKAFDLRVVVPMADMLNPPPPPERAGPETSAETDAEGDGDWFTPSQPSEVTGSVWPHVEEAIVDRVLAHRSTIVFANSRRLAERLTAASTRSTRTARSRPSRADRSRRHDGPGRSECRRPTGAGKGPPRLGVEGAAPRSKTS